MRVSTDTVFIAYFYLSLIRIFGSESLYRHHPLIFDAQAPPDRQTDLFLQPRGSPKQQCLIQSGPVVLINTIFP